MSNCYYSYSFDLESGLILEENLDKNVLSPLRVLGLKTPLDFDDYIDVWKALCYPVFEDDEDVERLTRNYFKKAYVRGERAIEIDLEHNPLKSTYATKYTRIRILLFEDEATKRARATVFWEDNPELEKKIHSRNRDQDCGKSC